jgi:hypothetical protein
MGLKNFKADLLAAAQKAAAGRITGVKSVKSGESDGEVSITFAHEALASPLRIAALVEEGKTHRNMTQERPCTPNLSCGALRAGSLLPHYSC